MDIVDRPIGRGTGQIGQSSFSLLFAEILQYCQQRAVDAQDLEERLKAIGHRVGFKMLNIIVARERPQKRDTTIVGVLQFITSTCWKTLYGRETNSLQRSTQNENEYFIYENNPIPNLFISVPRELQGRLNCASFNAGLIRGLLDAAQFPTSVRAVVPPADKNGVRNNTTVYVVKFSPEILIREQQRKY
mmetsp:Transcript_20226/g.33390  ORF Transcript_20226/g.33390 Transcript_20226/m.33390 type:complete len:189 (-) Transcript_20226:798-1364(-)